MRCLISVIVAAIFGFAKGVEDAFVHHANNEDIGRRDTETFVILVFR